MKEITVEHYALVQEEDQEPGRLSFCDLPDNSGLTDHQSPITSAAQENDALFEFFVYQPVTTTQPSHNDVVSGRKFMHEEEEDDDHQLNEYQKRDYFANTKSKSTRRPSFSDHSSASATADNWRVSASNRFSGDLDYHAQGVNISSLTSMSAKSRRWMFMFGPVKFKPEMELSAIKQRQAARGVVVPAAEKSGGGKSRWGVVRWSLRGRSHLTELLARSLGCVPAVAGGGGGERWVGVANQ